MKELSFNDYVAENTPHCTAELICIKCVNRWIGCWPETLQLKDIICPYCNKEGGVITTGQILEEDYSDDT